MLDWEVIIRLLMAMVLGGLIGFEREIGNRPAGFRTHTLVCVGSTLVMLTSQYLFEAYSDIVNLDPARLGAQVISGIGFLGAGTIIKSGRQVRGLTTAASLWVVACVGLAVGAGFYLAAVSATIFVYVTLLLLKKVEKVFMRDVGITEINLDLLNRPGQIAKVTDVMGRLNIQIRDIRIIPDEDEGADVDGGTWLRVKFYVRFPPGINKKALLAEMKRIDGVITEEEEG